MLIWCSVAVYVVGGGLLLAAAYRAFSDLVSYHMGRVRFSVDCQSISREAIERYRRNREQQIHWMETSMNAEDLEGPFKSVLRQLRADVGKDDCVVGREIRASEMDAFANIFAVHEVRLSRPPWRVMVLLALGGMLLVAGSMIESLLS